MEARFIVLKAWTRVWARWRRGLLVLLLLLGGGLGLDLVAGVGSAIVLALLSFFSSLFHYFGGWRLVGECFFLFLVVVACVNFWST